MATRGPRRARRLRSTDGRQHIGRGGDGCQSRRDNGLRHGGEAGQPPQAADRSQGGDGGDDRRQRLGLRDPIGGNFLYVKRPVEQLKADQILKSRHRILCEVYAKLLKILKDLKGSNNIKDRLARVRKCVVGESIDGAPGGVPTHPEVLQDLRNEVIQRVVDQRVVCKLDVSYTYVLQKIHQPLREI